ncbi:hypothetical protein [Mesorhizobium sp.]|uniref:hypothetical protein n=1 Tax=Mesorhizobium sp. TaxID=1871066 RepID=UPI000FE908A9|nr:hypothetical protein [Mesorhizobium sp.]RWQ04085.1 MAG: hypothetical protein EOR89_08315 [Mesorhizobium sp.]RWQ52160.1 MAG: hypothetical protein EOS82_11495 [Mesorhizobium sp.]
MLRLFATLCALILLSPMASASALYDELAAAKIKLLGTTRPGPGMGLWAQQTNERLMSLIEGKWIDLGYSDLTSEDNMNKYCDKFGESFKKLTDYSFDIIGPITVRSTRSTESIFSERGYPTTIDGTLSSKWRCSGGETAKKF